MDENLLYQIALSKIPNVGAKTGKTLIAYCGGVKEVFEEKKSRLLKIPGIGDSVADAVHQADPYALGEPDLKYVDDHKLRTMFYLGDNYPARLKNFDDAPLLLYAKGAFEPNPRRNVAIVGTRQPTPYGISACEQIVADLKAYDVQIVSGLAHGVDAVAHRAACQEGVENLAIMGTGMDTLYPAAHRELSHKIMEKGALISEYPIHTRIDRENFPRRNRVIAAMSDVIIVIQSASKGGSLITAEFGNQYFKDVFALPGRVNDAASAGCNQLIKQHKAHLLESVKDIAYIMRWETDKGAPPVVQQELFIELSDDEREIIELLKAQDEVSIDELHINAKKTLGTISTILLTLEMKGLVRALPGSRYTMR